MIKIEWCSETRALKPELEAVLTELYVKKEIPFSDYASLVEPINPCELKLQIMTHLLATLQLAGKKEAVRKILEAMRA